MIDSPRQKSRRRPIAAAVFAIALAASGCASSPSRENGSRETPAPAASSMPVPPGTTVFGVAGDHFVAIDTRSGIATELAESGDLWEVGALTYDPTGRTFYAVAHAITEPELVAIDRDSGATRTIGPIDLPNVDLTRVEGLAFDPVDGVLYATGDRLSFASSRLMTIDTASGRAEMIARVHGTAQNDVDALVTIGGKLYGIDVAGNSSALYQIDKESGQASLQPRRFNSAVTDVAFDPESRRLLAAAENSRSLLVMTPGGQVEVLGPTHSETGLGGWPITALACVTASTEMDLLGDDFESGDLSSWGAGSSQ